MNLGSSELIIILILVLLVFGGAKLPKLARSLGQAQREFKDGLAESKAESADTEGGAGRSSGDKRSGNSVSNESA